QPTGQTELLEGTATVNDDNSLTMVLGYSEIANTTTAKFVEATIRHYVFNPDRTAVYTEFDMAAGGQEMQQHLSSELHKQEPTTDSTSTTIHTSVTKYDGSS